MTQSMIHYYSTAEAGNSVVFLTFKVRGGEKCWNIVLDLKNLSENASYISKTFHNNLTSFCGKFIRESVVKKTKENQYF